MTTLAMPERCPQSAEGDMRAYEGTQRLTQAGHGALKRLELCRGSMHALNEYPSSGRWRPVFEGHDAHRPALWDELDRKNLQRLMEIIEAKNRAGEHRHEVRRCSQLATQMY